MTTEARLADALTATTRVLAIAEQRLERIRDARARYARVEITASELDTLILEALDR